MESPKLIHIHRYIILKQGRRYKLEIDCFNIFGLGLANMQNNTLKHIKNMNINLIRFILVYFHRNKNTLICCIKIRKVIRFCIYMQINVM